MATGESSTHAPAVVTNENSGSTVIRLLGLAGGGSLLAASIGAGLAMAAAPAGAATFTVANLDDAGAGSLRQAILDANASPTADVIEFAPGLSGTLALTSGKMVIAGDTTITGPGAEGVTIDAGGSSQIFYIYDSTHVGAVVVTIEGLTLTNGHDAVWGGGAIAAWSSDLTLRDVTITNSVADGTGVQTGRGGAIFHAFAYSQQARDAVLTLDGCHLSGNSAGTVGGAVALYNSGGAVITDTVIDDNSAGTFGGGVFEFASSVGSTISTSRISGNTAVDGGGVRVQGQLPGADHVLDRVSVVDNTATGQDGSAVSLDHNDGTTEILTSTIADNASGGVGGFDATMVHIAHSTISGNSNTGVRSANRGINIDSSVLADNGLDLGTDADVSWSVVETGDGHIVAGADNLIGVDPGLSSLYSSSATAWVVPITSSSAAFNSGDPAFVAPPSVDQTGRARVVFGIIDIGAFEVQSDEPATTTTTTGDDPIAPSFTG